MTGDEIDIIDGDSYAFTIAAATDPSYVEGTYSVIANRFVINYNASTYPVASVTTNAYGLATFSYDQNLTAIEAGVKLYKGAISGEYLNLTQVDYVEAGEGVLVYGEANTTYHFSAGTGTSDFSGNELKAASAWAYPHAGYNAYVLSGSSLYLYEGDAMKPNKAFLLLSTGAGVQWKFWCRAPRFP